MTLMTWSEHFVTGLETVDAQHRELVNLINAAAPHLALSDETALAAAKPLLQRLTEYAATHFRYEEGLMAQAQVEPNYLRQHSQAHRAFVDEVKLMQHQLEHDGNFSGNDLLRFLTSWLTFHILSEDKSMASQVRAIRSGRSAEQAQAEADIGEGVPQAVYTTALIDLFTLLTERNHTLVQANEQVRSAQAALALANQQLEVRVLERTRELAKANVELESERAALVQSMEQLEQAQGQLLQSEKMAAVGQLAAGVAHEINNPIGFVTSNLSSLSSYVQQLFAVIDACEKTAQALPPDARSTVLKALSHADLEFLRQDIPELLKESRDGLQRVKRIVGDLRDFSHVDDMNWQQANLNEVLESALNVVANELKFKAEVVKDLAPSAPAWCLSAQLNQVFVNLLVNAAQAIDSKGLITLRTRVEGDKVSVEICDTGRGMTAQIQQHVFEPFYTTKPVGQGTGLGLSISWDIVQRHHGSIEVHSAPGEGTCFRIVLPQGAAARAH